MFPEDNKGFADADEIQHLITGDPVCLSSVQWEKMKFKHAV